jgi:membrane associated rhomboid family serine protease
MIPIGDELPTLRVPVVTMLLLAAIWTVWLFFQGAGLDELQLAASICNWGMVPGELTGEAPLGFAVPIARNAVPTVGASGAISGVLGAYLALYPRARVAMLFFPFVFRVRAWLVLVMWFGVQVVAGLPALTTVRPDVSGGVAVWAHVGGFIAGLLLVSLFRNRALVEADRRMMAAAHTGFFR